MPATSPGSGDPKQVGRYLIVSKLGAGAFGTVYKAHDPQLKRDVALKVPNPGVISNATKAERFLREAEAAARLRHANIVPVFDAGHDGDRYFIATAFIDGRPLADAIDETGMDPRRAATIVRQLAEAVAYAHKNKIVHRDIKPANVLLDAEDRPLLADFGLAARADDSAKLTNEGAVLGTPSYMAPEQAAGQKGEAKPAADQYALGVVLYELLTGRTPFEGPPASVIYSVIHREPPPPRSIRPDVPPGLDAICRRAMAKKPDHRYPDCQALATALEEWLGTDPEPILEAPLTSWSSRRWRWAIAGAAVAVSLGVAVVLINANNSRNRNLDRGGGVSPPDVGDQTQPADDRTYTSKTTGMKFVRIKAGTFMMGSPQDEKDREPNENLHEVVLTKDYYLGVYEVTRGQFRLFVEDTGYKTDGEVDGTGGYGWDTAKKNWVKDSKFTWRDPGFPQSDDHPVVLVNWFDAVRYCEWLSRKDGRTYQLPTEAQWEYACRAESNTRYSFGNDDGELAKYGNVADVDFRAETGGNWGIKASDGYRFTAPVGRFKPNAYGVYDVVGNVWEWCKDYYGPYDSIVTNRDAIQLIMQSEDKRVLRGGSWDCGTEMCRVAIRLRNSPNYCCGNLGFRVCFPLN